MSQLISPFGYEPNIGDPNSQTLQIAPVAQLVRAGFLYNQGGGFESRREYKT